MITISADDPSGGVGIMAIPSGGLYLKSFPPSVGVYTPGQLRLSSDPPSVTNILTIPKRAFKLTTAAPAVMVSPIGDTPTVDLAFSTSTPVINPQPIYFSQGTVVSDQISDMGFSMPGHGPGLFLEIRASDTDQWEVISIQVPRA